MSSSDLSTVEDLARHFGVSEQTVRRWVRSGKVPHLRPSRRVIRFHLQAVEDALSRTPDGAGQDVVDAGL